MKIGWYENFSEYLKLGVTKETRYKLAAVVEHLGQDMHTGHNIASVFRDDIWYEV